MLPRHPAQRTPWDASENVVQPTSQPAVLEPRRHGFAGTARFADDLAELQAGNCMHAMLPAKATQAAGNPRFLVLSRGSVSILREEMKRY